jgi:hypothetical protein
MPEDILGEIREYLKRRIIEPECKSNMKAWDLYTGVSKYKNIYQSEINLVNSGKGDLLAYSQNTSLKWKSNFCESLS